MLKSELIKRAAAKKPNLYERDLEKVIKVMLEEIVVALHRGDRVEIRGVGVFSVRTRLARVGRNPRTGASVPVQQRLLPYFKPGKEMRKRLNRPNSDAMSVPADEATEMLFAPRPARG